MTASALAPAQSLFDGFRVAFRSTKDTLLSRSERRQSRIDDVRHAIAKSSFAIICFCVIGSVVTAAEKTPVYSEHQDLGYHLDGDRRVPIKTVDDWTVRKQHILANMQTVMGRLPNPKEPISLDVEVIDEKKIGGLIRRKITYHTDSKDAVVSAYLFLPQSSGKKVPGILCLHQTTRIGKEEPAGLGGKSNLHYALHLARRGYVTLAPDYPSFGDCPDYDFDNDDYVSGTMKAIYDNTRAVDLLQSLAEVDGEHIGCIGHSLGGHNTMFTAAFDPRIKVMVSNCGFTRFHKYYEGKLKGWTSKRYMPRINDDYGNDPDNVPFDFTEIVASFAPRPFLASSPVGDGNFEVSGVKDAIAAAKPIYELHGKPDNLQANYPECGHDFPQSVRKVAYEFFDKHLEHTPTEWRAAAAAIVITPQKPMWMAGYASRNKPSEGKIHDLFAKVLLLEDENGTRIAMVTTDLIGIKPFLRDAVAAKIQDRYGIPPESLLMNASHTHCGPELREDVVLRYGLSAETAAFARQYTQQLAGKIADMIGRANENLEPAKLIYTHARAGFAMNRRLPTENGFINSPNPDGPVDHSVPVLQVHGFDQKFKAVMFGYSCHNTTLGIYKFCGDYAGFAHQFLEEAHPGTIAMFMMGCGGDQNPYPRSKLELAQQHGRTLANAVDAALQTRRTRVIHPPLRVALDDVTLKFATPPTKEELTERAKSSNKYERRHAERLLKQLEENGKIRTEYDFPMQAIQFGDDMTMVAIAGEVVVDYSIRLKRELSKSAGSQNSDADPIIWIAGYSNNVFGYLPSKRVLLEGGYEGARAMTYTSFPGPFDESVEELVIQKIHELVDQLRGE